jgi:hypothetical protein
VLRRGRRTAATFDADVESCRDECDTFFVANLVVCVAFVIIIVVVVVVIRLVGRTRRRIVTA